MRASLRRLTAAHPLQNAYTRLDEPVDDAPQSPTNSGSADTPPSLLEDLYGDYFAPTLKAKKKVRFDLPPAPAEPSINIVHVSKKLKDPLWLVPKRPAPMPPRPEAPVPMPVIEQPSGHLEPIASIMAREVLRIAHKLETIAEHIACALPDELEQRLLASKILGKKLERALDRLTSGEQNSGSWDIVAESLGPVGQALTHHIRALIDVSAKLPPLPRVVALKHAVAFCPPEALRMVVCGVPFELPMALASLQNLEQACPHPPCIKALGVLYKRLYAEIKRLPLGGDPRLQLNLPNKIYTPNKTPGQLALVWQEHINALYGRAHAQWPAPRQPQNLTAGNRMI